jgi:hypothetical protein
MTSMDDAQEIRDMLGSEGFVIEIRSVSERLVSCLSVGSRPAFMERSLKQGARSSKD